MKPPSNRIFIRHLGSKRNQIPEGIVIPEMATEKPMQAKLVAVVGGSGRTGQSVPPRAKKGHRVLIGQYAGQEMEIEAIDYLILKKDEILGIIG